MLDSVTVRPILPDELEKVAYVHALSYGIDRVAALTTLRGDPRLNSSHFIVAEYQSEVVGTTTVFPAQMWLSGVPLNVGVVMNMAVLPEFRRRGIATKMMEFAIMRMVAEGRAMSILFPFSYKYYRQFGYGTIGDVHAYRINPNNLIVYSEGHKVRPFTPQDLPMVRVIYKGQLTWHNGWLTRSNEWWAKIIARWPDIMVYDNDGTIEGYYSYEIKTSKRGERELHIHEFLSADDAAFRGLVGYLAAQNEADVIEYLAPPDTPLRHIMRQPWADNTQNHGWFFNDLCHIVPALMGRIINLPLVLTKRFYTRGLSGERIIKISDPLIPTNEEPLLFRVVDGRAETRPADNRKPQIETDTNTMAQILCGYLSPHDAARLGRLQANEDTCSWLAKVVADTPLYIQAGDWS